MTEPGISWRTENCAEGKVEVLVVAFDLGVEIRISGELGLRSVHWKTSPNVDAEAQRGEVARAVEWGRLHDGELRARFKDRRGALRMGETVRRLAADAFGMPAKREPIGLQHVVMSSDCMEQDLIRRR